MDAALDSKSEISTCNYYVKVCDTIEISALVSKEEISIKKKNNDKANGVHSLRSKKHKCELCPYEGITPWKLKDHMRKHTKPFTCHLCEFKTAQQNNLKRHIGRHLGIKPFVCNICEYKCGQKSQLTEHLKSHTGETRFIENKQFMCKLCDFRSRKSGGLIVHMRSHTGEKPYACNLCEYKIASSSSVRQHLKYKHLQIKSFICNLCEYKTTDKNHLVEHVTTHETEQTQQKFDTDKKNGSNTIQPIENKSYKLETVEAAMDFVPEIKIECDDHVKIYDTQQKFNIHVKSASKTIQPIETELYKHENVDADFIPETVSNDYVKSCAIIGDSVNVKTEEIHIKEETEITYYDDCDTSNPHDENNINNNKTETYKCGICPFEGSNINKIRIHMRSHTGEKPFACHLCEFKTAYQYSLDMHIKRHMGIKPFACNMCEYKCTEKNQLKNHIKSHTGENQAMCTLCNFKSTCSTTLKSHMRTHTGEKPFKCHLCEFSTAQKANLNRHIKRHLGIKPFACNICGYRCGEKSQLTEHLKSHTGETRSLENKRFMCKLCNFRSAKSGGLRNHMRTHTGEKPYACHLCEHRTISNSSLHTHLKKKHLKVKPFICNLCGYKSGDENCLVEHLKIHEVKQQNEPNPMQCTESKLHDFQTVDAGIEFVPKINRECNEYVKSCDNVGDSINVKIEEIDIKEEIQMINDDDNFGARHLDNHR